MRRVACVNGPAVVASSARERERRAAGRARRGRERTRPVLVSKEVDVTYRLIPTGEAERQRVLNDVACSHGHHTGVLHACRLGEFPSHWALDADTGNYLVGLMPELMSNAEHHAFSCGGALFEVRFDNMLAETVRIKPLCGAVIGDVPAFREQLTRAFAAHGRHGRPDIPSALVPQWPQTEKSREEKT